MANYDPIGTPGGTNYWDQSGTPRPPTSTVTDITKWPMTPGPGLQTGAPQVPVSGGDNPYIPPPFTPNTGPAAPQGRFGEWLSKVGNWNPDVTAIRQAVADANGSNIENVSEADLMEALVNDMLAKTGAIGSLSPMVIAAMRNRARSGQLAGKWNLQNVGNPQAQIPQDTDMVQFLRQQSAGTYGGANAPFTPSNSMSLMWNVRNLAKSNDPNDPRYAALAGSPADQLAIAQAHLRNLGYSGMWARYLNNLVGQSYQDWTATPEQEQPATYLEYLDQRMPQGRTWYPGF